MFDWPRNHHDVAYDYFAGTGRWFKSNNCQRTAVLARRVAQCIEASFRNASIDKDKAARIQGVLGQVFNTRTESTNDEQKLLPAQKAMLEDD